MTTGYFMSRPPRQPSLSEDAPERSFRQLSPGMRNSNLARLRRMLELAVTASHVVHVPSVSTEEPDHLRASHCVYHTHSCPMESSWKSARKALFANRYARIVVLLTHTMTLVKYDRHRAELLRVPWARGPSRSCTASAFRGSGHRPRVEGGVRPGARASLRWAMRRVLPLRLGRNFLQLA